MSNRRKPRPNKHTGGHRHQHQESMPPFASAGLSPEDDAALSRTIRSKCDQCGAPVKWVGPDEATEQGMDLNEAKAFLGVDDVAGLDVWVCTRCDNGGVMGKAEVGH